MTADYQTTMTDADTADGPSRSAILWGVVFWVVFSGLAVGLRGVRWDETFEHGQIILRSTPYPAAHPWFRLERGAFTINGYLSAGLLWLTASPLVVCTFRNVAALLMTTVPVFLLGCLAARRAIAGHVAVVVVLLGTLNTFASFYPLAVWPNGFSNGPIGQGYALLALYFLLAGRRRLAYLLVGLMPLVHVGQAPIVYLVTGLYTCWLWRTDRGEVAPAVGWAGVGWACCAVFLAVKVVYLDVAPPTSGPYYSPEEAGPIWTAWSALYDVHGVRARYNPVGHRNIVLVAMLLLGGAAAACELRRRKGPGVYTWLAVYGLSVAAVIWIVAGLQRAVGPAASFWLVVWMPHRFSNHVALLLVVLAVGLLCRKPRAEDPSGLPGGCLVAALLLYAALWPVLVRVVPEDLYAHYLGGAPEGLAFALWGGAWAVMGVSLKRDRRLLAAYLAATVAACAGLGSYHQFGAACCVAGALVVAVGSRSRATAVAQERDPPPNSDGHEPRVPRVTPAGVARLERVAARPAVLACLCILVSAGILAREYGTREHLPVSAFERNVVAYLEARGEEDAMLLAPYWQIFLQARTGHPVMVDYQTAHLMTYMPDLAPTLKKIHLDFYGKRIDEPYPPGLDEWVARSKPEWRALAQEYTLRYVVSPEAYPLDLPIVVHGDHQDLYHIPPSDAG